MQINLALPKTKQKKLPAFSHRELLIIFCFSAAIIVGWFFPAKSAGEFFWISIFLFLIFPALIIKFLLKEPLAKFGLSRGKPKTGIVSAISFAVIAIVIMIFLIKIPELRNQIRLLPGIASSFSYFLGAELIIIPIIFFSREFFFRGFIQLGLEEKFGGYALLLQAALFALLFVKSSWLELAYAFLSALAAGLIVKFSRSIYYSFPALWIISLVTDILVIRIVSRSI